MSLALFKYTSRSNWAIGLIIFLIMFMYLAVIISMYDPDNIDNMSSMLEMLPEEMVNAMGYSEMVTDLISFIAAYYYGFLIYMFPLIYIIIVGNRLMASHVDRGSMIYLLSTPNSRIKIANTQAVFFVVSVSLLIALIAAMGLMISFTMFPGELDVGAFLSLNMGAIALFFAVSAVCFFFSCLFNESKYSLAFGGGILVLFFVINMLANVGDSYSWLKYLTLFSLYDPMSILAGEQSVWLMSLVLTGIAGLFYGAGIYVFNRRDLPL